MRAYPTELRADLQRFFGLDLDQMGRAHSVAHYAACAACLPWESATLARMNPEHRWPITALKVHELTCAAVRTRLPLPWDKETQVGAVEFEAVPVEEFDRWIRSKQH